MHNHKKRSIRSPMQVAPVQRPAQATGQAAQLAGIAASGKVCGPGGCVHINGFPGNIIMDR